MSIEPRPAAAGVEPSAWITRRSFTASGAAVAEFAPGIEPAAVFARLAAGRHCLFLDSVPPAGAPGAGPTTAPRLDRHSFVAVDPIHSLELAADATADMLAEAFARLRLLLADLTCPSIPGLPPFQGGIAGLVSYECGLARLGLSARPSSGAAVPLVSLHVYDTVCGFDHDSGRGWIISQGVPARGPVARRARAEERLASLLAALEQPVGSAATREPTAATVDRDRHLRQPSAGFVVEGFGGPGLGPLVSTQSPESHRELVRAGIELVRSGDVFQVNLAQQFTLPASLDPVALHLRGRLLNPAPFAGFFACGPATVVSMSPERLLQVERRTVRMHPIKGTRRMLALPEADLYAGEDLERSEKDRAENVMIVDLVRNDLSRVCTPESVQVEALCRLERYRYVQHLVSIVSGRLRPELSPLDALDAAIPGGSVTGAPKRRACEIITELEGFRRGAYCGSLGYVGFDGSADFNLLIRSFTVWPDSISFAVGGGITARSVPALEHAETLHKAEGMLRVLASFADSTPAVPGRSEAAS